VIQLDKIDVAGSSKELDFESFGGSVVTNHIKRESDGGVSFLNQCGGEIRG